MEPSSSSSLTPYQLLEEAGSNLKKLKQIHAHLITSKTNHIKSLLTKLAILASSTRNSSSYTRNLSLSIPDPDSYLFNSLIRISSKLDLSRRNDVLFYYNQMILLGLPLSSYTFTGVIKGCGGDGYGLRVGKRVHSHVVVNGFGSDTFVQAGLVMFYAKCGEVKVARKVFDEMPEKSIVAWNSMISGYEQNGMTKDAIEVFKMMKEEGVEPDSVTFVGVISACAQLGGIVLGLWVHDCILECGVISACAQLGNDRGVIRVVKILRMCEDCHLAIKFISSVTGKEIIVRDKLCFHHFKDGVCFSGDY